jgi:hypothetical protein
MKNDGWDYLRMLDEKELLSIIADPDVPSSIKMKCCHKLMDKAIIESLDRRMAKT